jgi:hypothetical protein
MSLPVRFRNSTGIAFLVLVGLGLSLNAQSPVDTRDEGTPVASLTALPDAPLPLDATAAIDPQQSSSSQSNPPSGSGSATQPASQAPDDKTVHDQAEQQLKQEEHQRVAGVMAAFNTTQNQAAMPLSPGQKFELFFKSETEAWPFMLTAVVAGIEQADNNYPQWGQGMQGYGKRFGAAYADAFIGNFFGNAVLPVALHEDPRFFQKTDGSNMSRFLWAASSTVWARRDNGKWGPNYANIFGNLMGAAVARVYYPASERTVHDTIYDGLTVTVEGVVGSEIIEFWPSIVNHYRAKKAAKQASQMQSQPSTAQ